MAYVLSHDKNIPSCSYQRLFKFNPLIFSSNADWSKRVVSLCGNLGLTFGREEVLLYAYSGQGSSKAISLLDLNGNPMWYLNIADTTFKFNTLL
jgi:hypothetical protein